MTASIMSPIDLQTNLVNIVVEGSNLSKDVEEKISKLLSDYFNKEVKLGRRLAKWIGESLYQSGAAPILILPQSNIYTVNRMIDADELEAGRDPRKLIHGIPATDRPNGAKLTSGESFITSDKASFEALSFGEPSSASYEAFLDRTTIDCMYGIEKLDFISDKHKTEIISKKGQLKENIKDLLENGKNWVVFSSDPSIITRHVDNLRSKAEQLKKDIDEHLVFNKVDPTYVLDTSTSEDHTDVEAAAIIELPYQSVIPIIVPGAPNQHIGYFVAVNQWGEPITPDSRDMNNMNAQSRVMEANMQATFGTPSALAYSTDMSNMQRFKTTSAIFGIMLRNFMQKKLEEYGLGGTQVEQHEAITSCIFRNLLDRKRIGLIFIPEPMMVYYRYDVHEDGTGKSLIEDIRTITGLRTTLVTAGIMAATENSIDQKVIELNVDEKQANVQQMMEQVKNAFIEKRIMRYDNNPLNVQRELIQKSLMLIPKGIKGLQDNISVNTDHKSAGVITPDDGLLKQLTDWTIQACKIPAAAINKTSEDDYARSVVTTNLFFNNRVKIYQEDTNEFSTKLVRTYIKYNTIIQDKILEVLKASDTDYSEYSHEAQELSADQKEKEQEKAEKLRKKDTHEHKSDTKIEKNKKGPKESLLDVVDHIYLKLSEPRIVVDKAQYEEITGFADCVDKVCSIIYSDELLADSMQDYNGMLKVLRARIKEQMVRNFIKTVGCQSVFDVPPLQDIDMDESEELAMLLINYKRGIDNIKEQVADKVNATGQDNGGGFGGGGYGATDMGGGFGGGGTDFGAGSDMTGGGADMNMNMGGETPGSEEETNAETNANTNEEFEMPNEEPEEKENK